MSLIGSSQTSQIRPLPLPTHTFPGGPLGKGSVPAAILARSNVSKSARCCSPIPHPPNERARAYHIRTFRCPATYHAARRRPRRWLLHSLLPGPSPIFVRRSANLFGDRSLLLAGFAHVVCGLSGVFRTFTDLVRENPHLLLRFPRRLARPPRRFSVPSSGFRRPTGCLSRSTCDLGMLAFGL